MAATLASAPRLRLTLTSVGAAYLVWRGGGMIWEARAGAIASRARQADVLRGSWFGIAAFQLLNPKAWVLLMTAALVMSRAFDGLRGLAALAAIYALRSALSLSVWAMAGSVLGRTLGAGASRRWFERALGGLLVALALLLVAGEVSFSGSSPERRLSVQRPSP